MKFQLTPEMTFPKLTEELKRALPQYEIKLLKNPIARFEFIQVKKSAWVGTWVRIFEKKNELNLVGCIPSTIARALFGGLIVLLFLRKAHKRLQAEIQAVLASKFQAVVKK